MQAASTMLGQQLTVRPAGARAQRRQFSVMANQSGPKKGTAAQGAQKFVGYKGATIAGSAPTTRAGKPGFVYKLGLKNGKANIDEYAPIYTPDQWKFDGDNYEPGLPGLAAWAATLGAILLGGAFAVYSTSAL